MNLLKNIPITYIGELHDVKLINFYVDADEVLPMVPAGITPRLFQGKALISMVDVQLRNMHPAFLPQAMHFEYRHLAFRLLVDDSALNNGVHKGIFFLRSFSDKALIVHGGNLLSDYRLEKAEIESYDNMLELRSGDNLLEYKLSTHSSAEVNKELHSAVSALDRAYSMRGDQLMRVMIRREKWPLTPVACTYFNTTFFKTARFAGAFTVNETIHYHWLPAEIVQLQPSIQQL